MIHKRVEWWPQRFVYKLSPFPFPLLVIFPPFPQTESLLTGDQCGVLQVSTFGPLLLFKGVNGMVSCLEKADIRTFFDYTTLFHSPNTLQDLEKT